MSKISSASELVEEKEYWLRDKGSYRLFKGTFVIRYNNSCVVKKIYIFFC